MPALKRSSTDTIGTAATTITPSISSSSKQTNRVLRLIPLFAFLPAFVLLLVHGIVTKRVFPALGLAPLGYSALLSAVLLWRKLVHLPALGCSPTGSVGAALAVLFVDTVLALMNLAFLIVTWIDMPKYRQWGRQDRVVLGTYGTVFMMMDCAIHVYFVARYGLQVLYAQAPRCPNCQTRLRMAHKGLGEHTAMYAPLAEYNEEDDCYKDVEGGESARQSTESNALGK